MLVNTEYDYKYDNSLDRQTTETFTNKLLAATAQPGTGTIKLVPKQWIYLSLIFTPPSPFGFTKNLSTLPASIPPDIHISMESILNLSNPWLICTIFAKFDSIVSSPHFDIHMFYDKIHADVVRYSQIYPMQGVILDPTKK